MRRLIGYFGGVSTAIGIMMHAGSALAGVNDVLLVGPIGAFGTHHAGPASTGAGIEVTYDHFPDGLSRFMIPEGAMIGGVAQMQAVGDHSRFLLGVQGGEGLGLELGPALETGDGPRGTTLSLHVAPFLSLGVVSVALRVGAPLAPLSSRPMYGTDVAAVLALKAPILVEHGRKHAETRGRRTYGSSTRPM
jgi:hypothetical protein